MLNRKWITHGPPRTVLRALGLEQIGGTLYAKVDHILSDTYETVTIERETIKFLPNSGFEWNVIRTQLDEEQMVADLVSEINYDDIVFDIGANLGVYTCIAAVHLTDGNVVAIDPVPANTARIQDNLAVNDVEDVATIRTNALSDEKGEADLAIRKSSWWRRVSGEAGALGNINESFKKDDQSEEIITTELVTGDELAEEFGTPSVIKIDVDGAEVDVLKGLQETLSNQECRLVYCEVHPEFLQENGKQVESVHQFLEEKGFEIEISDEHVIRGSNLTTSTYTIKAAKS